ncbi:hypothetical protein CCACVL1_04243 [Corchorus capsularis]|uniref:Uncharacterized protein n=1 Tax=Corchorus capsularis TaxID=210143 RepID=A0A1R3JTX6_COCAP|nr:hypothetical protein CCACVL1_04243 [Corchorus capsularis]
MSVSSNGQRFKVSNNRELLSNSGGIVMAAC